MKKKRLNGQGIWNDIKFMLTFKWSSINLIVFCELLGFILVWCFSLFPPSWSFVLQATECEKMLQTALGCYDSFQPRANLTQKLASTLLDSQQFSSCKSYPSGSGGNPGWTAQQAQATKQLTTHEIPQCLSIRWCLSGKEAATCER